MSAPDLRCILVWPNGRRQEEVGGGIHWIVPTIDRETGRTIEHTFDRADETFDRESLTVEFHLAKSEDVTARMRENHERFQNRAWRMRGLRRPVMELELRALLPGETVEEHKRRVAIILSGEE